MVKEPFSNKASLDILKLKETVSIAVRMMDNVIDVSRFPLPAQEEEARSKRRIGLGVTGLADALLMIGVRYGSDDAASITEQWLHLIARESYLASIKLAKEKGPFPLFDVNKFLSFEVGEYPDDIDDIRSSMVSE